MSKLPASLIDIISTLCDNLTAVAHLYAELQNILLRSYSFSVAKKTARLLDHPGLGPNKPSVLKDQLIALKPDSLDDDIQVLFFRKMLRHIRDVVNPKNLYDLTKQSNEVWENRAPDASGMSTAATVQWSHSPACGNHCSSSPFHGQRTSRTKSAHRRSPTPALARGSQVGAGWCSYRTCCGHTFTGHGFSY
jgi:hypothetical protein